jgi:hypothetical protein
VRNVTYGLRGLLVLAVFGLLATSSAASPPPTYVFRDVAFVTVIGHGSVKSTPRGIHCPGVCRATYVRGTHMSFKAAAAPGWRFRYFSSTWCGGHRRTCAFDLVSSHDCVGGACPLGAYGVRAVFVRVKPPS